MKYKDKVDTALGEEDPGMESVPEGEDAGAEEGEEMLTE